LRESTVSDNAERDLIFANWQQAVGRRIALHARPLRFDDGRLWVGVESAEWMPHLKQLRLEIRYNLNQALGASIVREIRLGPLPGRRMPPQSATHAAPDEVRDPVRRRIYEQSKQAAAGKRK
jgi:predicted nucleic acid-binding Zn ribbon protein